MNYVYPRTSGDYRWIPSDQWQRRLTSLPVPNHLKIQMTRLFVRWATHSGPEWAVDRMKALKDCIMQSWASDKKLSHRPDWFSTNRRGDMVGPPGQLFSYAMKSVKTLKAALFLCNICTAVSRKSITEEIDLDIGNNIESTPVFTAWGDPGSSILRKSLACIHKRSWSKKLKLSWPEPISLVAPGKHSHVLRLPESLQELNNHPMTYSHKELLTRAVGGRFACTLIQNNFQLDFQKVGDIHVTHEPGLKTRYFASPNIVMQRALEPLKEGLFELVKEAPWDCTLSQRKADGTIQAALQRGLHVSSIDMSKATDNFPWFYQKKLLAAITDRSDKRTREAVRLFIDIVENGQWELPESCDYVTWTKGQPLGLGPSFPLFTLSHGVLLYALNNCAWDRKFYVLGDDVIILDEDLASRYRNVLKMWGVQVSEQKSFCSKNLAQFAGVTYTKEDCFFVPKWRAYTRDTLLDCAARWYPGLTSGMRDEVLIDFILALPKPYGIGRNPGGIPLDDRFPQWVADVLVSREIEREREARPCAIDSSIVLIHNMLLESGDPVGSYSVQTLVDWWRYGVSKAANYRLPTGKLQGLRIQNYVPGTFVPGCPYIRLTNARWDPYTLGTISSWRKIVMMTPPSSE